MDKHSNNKISVTFNGKERTITLPDSSDHEDESIQETASHKLEEEFPWLLPDQQANPQSKVIDFESRKNSPKKLKGFKQKKPKPFARAKKWSGKWSALITAIMIGLFFGFLVLSVFTDFVLNTSKEKSVTTQPKVQPQAASGALPNEPEAPKPSANVAPVAFPAVATYVIQGGVFSSEASANILIDKLQGKGFPATVVNKDGKVYAFIGIGMDKDTVSQIGETYKKEDQPVYVKAYQVTAKTVQADDEKTAAFMKNGVALFTKMVKVTALAWQDPSLVAKEDWTSIEQAFLTWKKQRPEGIVGLTKQFAEDLTKAGTSLGRAQSKSNVLQSQQALLESLLDYEKWLSEQKQ